MSTSKITFAVGYLLASIIIIALAIQDPNPGPVIQTEYVMCEEYKAVLAKQFSRINAITEATNLSQATPAMLLRVEERFMAISTIIADLPIPKCVNESAHWSLVRSIQLLAYSYDVRVNGNPAEANVIYTESIRSISEFIQSVNGAQHD